MATRSRDSRLTNPEKSSPPDVATQTGCACERRAWRPRQLAPWRLRAADAARNHPLAPQLSKTASLARQRLPIHVVTQALLSQTTACISSNARVSFRRCTFVCGCALCALATRRWSLERVGICRRACFRASIWGRFESMRHFTSVQDYCVRCSIAQRHDCLAFRFRVQ